MKISEITLGKTYIFDKENLKSSYETDIILVKVWKRYRLPTGHVVEIEPLNTKLSNFKNELPNGRFKTFIKVDEDIMSEYNPENKDDNVVIRYPIDMPVFNIMDLSVAIHMAEFATGASKTDFSDSEMLGIASLIEKIRFYSQRNEDITSK